MLTKPEPWLVDAVRGRARDFAVELRSVPNGAAAVPGLDWTVADLGQHVACLPSYGAMHNAAGPDFVQPENFADFSDQARAHITETDPSALADLIEAEYSGYVDELAAETEPRWMYAIETTATGVLGMVLSEFVLHGRDLAGVTGSAPPTFTRAEANAAVRAVMITAPAFVDADKAAAQPDGIYHLRFRGGDDYTWHKQGSELVVSLGRPARADARMNADPATFVMSSLGRVGQLRAGLTGGIVAYGRRPWRFLGLGMITADGV